MFNFDASALDSADFKEDSVRELIITPMLARLGYGPTGDVRAQRSKTLDHPFVHIGTRKHAIKIIPDYTIYEGDTPLLILDAKAPSENVRKSANVEQAYSYAIHQEIRSKHYGLCNGKRLVIFRTDEFEPILDLAFVEFDTRWADIEKAMGLRFLRNPVFRNFVPDLGFLTARMGLADEPIPFEDLPIASLGRVNDGLVTASNWCKFAGADHMMTFDFSPNQIEAMASSLPDPLAVQLRRALSWSPGHAFIDGMIHVWLVTRLGRPTKGEHEWFVPFVVSDVLASKFSTEAWMPREDFPERMFNLRRAYEQLEARK